MTMHGDLAIAGIQWSDLAAISERVVILSVVVTFLGIGLLKLLAAKSVALMLTLVVGVSVICSLLGVGVIAWLMMGSTSDRDVMIDLMAIAGLGGFAVAMFVGRRLITASHALSSAVQNVGESGVYIAPQMTLPAELAELSTELELTHERLTQARTRERALEASRRELVAWVSHDLRTPLAGLRAMAEALEDQVVVDPREVSQYHTQIRREVDRLTAMIDDLFELARIHAGALRLSRRLVGLDDLVARLHGAFGASNVDAVYTHWGSAFKAAAHELGLPVGSYARSRPPQPPLPEVQKAAIRSAYRAIGLVQAAP